MPRITTQAERREPNARHQGTMRSICSLVPTNYAARVPVSLPGVRTGEALSQKVFPGDNRAAKSAVRHLSKRYVERRNSGQDAYEAPKDLCACHTEIAS